MQSEIKFILTTNFPPKELFINNYHNDCNCYVISSKNIIYKIERNTKINFKIASVIFIKKEDNGICMFATSNKYKRKGFGKNLFKYIVENFENLYLYVRISNLSAIELYKSFGFQIIEEFENFYEYTDYNESSYLMKII